ncbi:MAG: 16S rRNA (cytidine(1402)-2'-O)-methyltransferase [Thermodesulfobacteriota bacterium]
MLTKGIKGKGALYIVATPLGNLEDITIRALHILKEVSLIAAEDTRHTRKLLKNYKIATPLNSYYEHNEERKGPRLVSRLKDGKDIALVSDAGTPGISDPGYRLVKLALENSIDVLSIPGPSAVIAALSIAGLPTDSFLFEGFIPSRQADRRRFVLGLKGQKKTVILYESPRRLKRSLKDIFDILGDVDIVIAREMTKLYEEVIRGKAGFVLEILKGREIKGEVTLLIGPQKADEVKNYVSIKDELKDYLTLGITLKDAVQAVVEQTGFPRKMVYREAIKVKDIL